MLTALALCGCAPHDSDARELRFSLAGRVQATRSLDAIGRESRARELTVHEPHLDAERTYRGFSFREVMDRVYGPSWREREEILFTCSDGYQPSVPVDEFLTYDAYLVFELADGSAFTVDNRLQNETSVPLGPFYVVWDNLKSPELQAEPPGYWPYQVVGLDLVSFRERFPALSPDVQASADVKTGFAKYRKYCMSCHMLEGEGGQKGPELAGLMGRRSRAWVHRYIDDPRQVAAWSTMARLNPDLKDRDVVIERILDFLEYKQRGPAANAE